MNDTITGIVEEQEGGATTREEMMQKLLAFPYKNGKFVEDESGAAVGYIPSSWDELVPLWVERRLTDEEFEQIVMTCSPEESGD